MKKNHRSILFIGRFYLKNDYDYIVQKSNGFVIDNAGNNLQWNYIRGFIENRVKIQAFSFSVLPPFFLFVKGSSEFYRNSTVIIRATLINLPFFKQLNEFFQTLTFILFRNKESRFVVIYSYYFPIVFAAILAKFFRKVHLTVIIPDLPVYQSSNSSFIYKKMKILEFGLLNKLSFFVDAFSLISKYMAELVPSVSSKNSVLIEGIVNPELLSLPKIKSFALPTFVYSGTLDPRYGILELVRAFMSLASNNVRLVILGEGPSAPEVIKASRSDGRIYYFGCVSYKRAIWIQRRATFLVNPRYMNSMFTKYSFPSKTLDYLGCRRPILGFRLPGIPEEYYSFIYTPDSFRHYFCTEGKLEMMLNDILMKATTYDLIDKRFHESLDEFLRQKTPKNQVQKLLNLMYDKE